MHSQRFRPLVSQAGPFVSMYFDDSHDTADAQAQLETRWSDLRKELDGVDDAVVALLEAAVLHRRPVVGRRGRGIIATASGVVIDEVLSVPPVTAEVRISEYPHVMPFVEFGTCRSPYVFACVDHTGADVVVSRGTRGWSEKISASGHSAHRGTSGDGYADTSPRTLEAIRKNTRAVADRLTVLADRVDAKAVFVAGAVRSRTEVVAALPPRIASCVTQLPAAARGSVTQQVDIDDAVATEFGTRRAGEDARHREHFAGELARGSGLAAEGMAAVCAALRTGDVETLIVGKLGEQTVLTGADRRTVAPDADTLSELGEPVARVVRADEALPFAAIGCGAATVLADASYDPADGIGAVLRYRTG